MGGLVYQWFVVRRKAAAAPADPPSLEEKGREGKRMEASENGAEI